MSALQQTKVEEELHSFYCHLREHNIVLVYEGIFNQEIVKTMLALTEKKLKSEAVAELTTKKLFNILMEGLQNICKHQMRSEDAENNSLLILSEDEKTFHLITGNMMLKEKTEVLKEKLEHVNSLSKERLKEYYKEARINSKISAVGGAGLGFIDMARKSENKLHYGFYTVTRDKSFFILDVTINK